MSQSTSHIAIVVDDPQPAKPTLFTSAYIILFQCIVHVPILALIAIYGLIITPIRPLWVQYYRRVVFGGEGVVMPHSSLSFITNALIALAAIKSQFQTDHPLAIMFSVSSLIIYGLASAAELVVCCAGLDPTSVYAITAHLGKIVSLCILVVSLASLFYM